MRGLVEVVRQCREEAYADLEKQDAEIERLQRVQGTLIAAFRVNMMRLSPEFSHEEFDKSIAEFKEIA